MPYTKKLLLQIKQLKRFFLENKRMPSYRELGALIHVNSLSAVQYLIQRLSMLGVVQKDSLGKLIPGRLFNPVKVLGTVRAGFPSPAEEENVDTISLDDWLIENKESTFMLKVSGDSMIDAGILPGDMVILDKGKNPKIGDVVVAEVDREWTIKYFEKRGEEIVLTPANKKYPLIHPKEELRIAGVVTAVVRKY